MSKPVVVHGAAAALEWIAKERYWFRRRRYGYGWTPSTWQGWLALAVFLIVVIAGVSLCHSLVGVIVVVAGAAFVALCVAKGEPPGWRWGRRD